MPPQPASIPVRRSIETVSIGALFITLVLAVLVALPSPVFPLVATKTFILAFGALITLALYILARLSRGNIIFPPLLFIGILWLPALSYLLSAAFSGTSFVSGLWGEALEADTLAFMVNAAMLGTLAALMLRRDEQYRSFLQVAAILYGFVAFAQLFILILGQVIPDTIPPGFSLLGTYENLAHLLGFGVIASLITLRFVELSKRGRLWLLGSLAGALFLLAVANSGLVWILVALVSLGLFVEAVLRRSPKVADADLMDSAIVNESVSLEGDEGSHSVLLPLGVLALALFFLIGSTLGNALAGVLGVNSMSVRPSWQSTFAVANETYATSPLFGTGPGTFGVEWLMHRDSSLNATVFWNLDFASGIGFIPTSFVTTGALGVFAWAVFLILFIWHGLRMLIRRTPVDGFIRYVAIVSFVASLYFFTLALFSLPSTVILALGFVFAGIFASTMRFATGGGQWGVIFSRSPRIGFIIVFALTLVLLSSVAALYALTERYLAVAFTSKAATAYAAGALDEAEKAAQRSITFSPTANAHTIQAIVAAARLDAIAATTTMTPSAAQASFQSALSTGINAALTSTRLAPRDYRNWVVLGNLYARAVPLGVTDAYPSAKTAYEKARALHPTNPQIPYIIAQLEIANRNLVAAEENLKAAIALKQDYTAGILLLSQLQVQTGKLEEALNSALAAAYFTPNDPNILFQVGILYAAQGDFANAATALSEAVEANPQFANARYFLSAVYVKLGDYANALDQMEAIAALSSENARAVESQLEALRASRNPFPANLLSVSSTPVE